MSYCRKKKWFKLIAGGLIIGLLVACGQVGPLYLPEKSNEIGLSKTSSFWLQHRYKSRSRPHLLVINAGRNSIYALLQHKNTCFA
ncbi:MAG: hypothetical protein A3I12_02355 [Gammaproteobacteria bacterium RIFCSPLOWO2_02_FULL_38_11]|nr:MAG: hypothetical protein A2W47_00745 [Gammaproteobacteria bacterium RIFCSPHIGHO2_12_38_15]OGT66907.1 MAG: hypothetical protein A3I12_02355 [Gammaproteobacteria bacterium RIFCSPLOWO2_02_FULL_38_11]OGT77240.1 MAG: hypothetical protein A3G71_01800 [Gammaproteobacteria bacterium RIFCSPLOWO2_12_FULL_38_14]